MRNASAPPGRLFAPRWQSVAQSGLIERSRAEFGGGPGDYQLVEEEDGDGQTCLTLVVHPGVGEINEEKLLSWLQQVLAQG